MGNSVGRMTKMTFNMKLSKIFLFTLTFTLISLSLSGQEYKNQSLDSVRVYISFIVEIDGKITKVKREKIECKGCSRKFKKNITNRAIEVVKAMPNFNEHKQRTKFILPMKFSYEDTK
jgi:hypothetical protein